jgi:ATP-dependent DNA helicase RecG
MNGPSLHTPLSELEWIAPQRARQLERFGLRSTGDLLTHYPRRYEDRRQFDRFPSAESDKPVCVCGIVVKAAAKRLGGWKKMFEVTLEEDSHALSNSLTCRWFNVHFVQKMIATGQRLVVYGKPKLRAKKIVIDHPEFEIVENDEDVSIHLKRIVPIHPATEGVSPRLLRSLVFHTLERMDDSLIRSRLPAGLDSTPLPDALRQIHFPANEDERERARRHLVLDEFFAMQMYVAAKRAETISRPGEAHCGAGRMLEKLHASLPFPLTGAQKRAIAEIRGDLASRQPMNRLLHGDVGSGKTLVALSAMLLAVEAGYQAALMAPTQILAEQHYLNFRRLLEPLGIGIALRTGARSEDNAPLPLFEAAREHETPGSACVPRAASGVSPETSGDAADSPRIIIGTHALLYEGVEFSRLGLVVIDEQHKFGVMQRARLIGQGTSPDVLVMTATPIPRTLTMTIYGDLDVSTLDEMPANRGKIVTAVRDGAKLPEVIKFIREHLEQGRQAYIVYPLIDESQKIEVKAATREFEKWRELLEPMKCELLHGRIEPADKDAIMQRFRNGESKALIATSVIEVGIDVPNANIMLIENAERFGLAQLHQLRGRIGRGGHKSYCILISTAENAGAAEKLKTLERTSDGFEIAEEDLKIRGPGDILGTAQSGLPPLKIGDLLSDGELIRLARQAATAIFKVDPHLQQPENQYFREMIAESKKLALSQVS